MPRSTVRALLVVSLAGSATAATLDVSGDANLFGAGHAVAPEPGGLGGGTLPPGFSFPAGPGQVLRITGVAGCVAMTVSFGNCEGPDGSEVNVAPTAVTSFGGISGINHDTNGPLLAVFLDGTEPVDPAPASLDFRAGALGTGFAVLAPALNQAFFTGDGLTGTGTGAVQDFLVPPTATRVFFGFADGNGYSGPPGAYFDNGGTFVVGFEIIGSCAPEVTSLPRDATTCEGQPVALDASGMTVVDCDGVPQHEWSDGAVVVGTTPRVVVTPTDTTTYTFTVWCSSDPTCVARAEAIVTVEHPPLFASAQARDVAACNVGIELAWPAATFSDPTGTGVYNVYRSTASCAAAVAAPPVLQGWTDTRWVDPSTTDGGTYHYVVEAEDARTSTACAPPGGDHGGAATRVCLAPVTEVADAAPPEVVCAPLRATHFGDDATLLWPSARSLLSGEHFHLLHGLDRPTAPFTLATPEGFRGRQLTVSDTSSPLQFFDLRVANACEVESANEYPPPALDEDTRPCP